MRYNAFFGELPLNAFKPRPSGGMTLEGGGNPISAVTNAVSDAVEGVGNIGQTVINEVGNAGKAIDQTVRDVLPGGWTTAALLAAGYYYQPEIAAYMNAEGATVPLSEVADASAFSGELPAGYVGYTAPEVTTLGTVAGPTEGMGTTLSDVAAGNADKAALYGNAGYGAGMTGAETGAFDAGLAAGAAGSAAGGAGGAAAGSTLSSMLPYMTAAQVGTGLLQSNSIQKAADIQSAAAKGATQLQGQMFNTINQQQAPYRTAGYGALNDIGSLGSGTYMMYDAAGNPTGTGLGSGYLTHQFDATDLAKGLAPNYNFMLQQGQMANQRAANVAGGGLGGNALQGLNKFTQDYAGNAYQNAFNNYQTQRGNIYNTLAGIAGIGQTGQNATNAAAANATNAATQLGVGSAAAQAAGLTGQTNALANTAQNVIGNYTLASLLNQRGNVA